MKTIKLLVVMCVAYSFSQCSSIKLTEKAPFTIFGATYHNWVGGQPGVRGTNLIIGIEKNDDITIKSIYFRNKQNTPSTENRKGKAYLVVNVSTSSRDGIDKIIEQPSKKLEKINNSKNEGPFKLEAHQAVIKYSVGKRVFYYKIKKIKKTETIFYP